MEWMAVQKAEQQLKENNENLNTKYFCIGYSVLYYYLDGDKIGNLIDQYGNEASVEIIATFLPKVVVDSLETALNRCDLDIASFTLEPIAAINLLIPPSMRRLNVALVDIGAGTSDIAITDGGTIKNYGMVPVAGDEITESISDHYLLDFPLAEEVKLQLSRQSTITFKDILGFENTVHREEMLKQIAPSIDHLAGLISQEILRINSYKPPKAVMLIGGGSLTPGIGERIAENLNLPNNRVAIRGVDAVPNLTFEQHVNKTPDLITPVGIAVSARHNQIKYKTVYVNQIPVRIFEFNPLTVGECLLQADIKLGQLYGKPGLAKIVSINGNKLTIPGKLGSGPVLLKNGHPCSLDETVEDGDMIKAERGRDGEEAKMRIKMYCMILNKW